MNQVMNVSVSVTVYEYVNTITQWVGGLYLIQDVIFQANPVNLVAVMKK